MIYLYYGTSEFQMQREFQKNLKTLQIESINISRYNYEMDSSKDILEDANSSSLFAPFKAIVVENATLFSSITSKKEEDVFLFSSYFENPNPSCHLFFFLNREKLDERKKIVKMIKKIGIVKEFNGKENLLFTIKNLFQEYQIEDSTISFLKEIVGENLYILEQEIEKIKLYKIGDKQVTKEDVEKIACRNIEFDDFSFLDAIIYKEKEKALLLYQEMLKRNQEPIKIIIMLANKIRLMYQVKELNRKGYTEKQIAEHLNAHPYTVKLSLQTGKKYDSDLLLKYLKELSDIDIQMKSGKADKNTVLELFILKM